VNSPEETTMETTRPVVVTGATGYVGGRLVPRLLETGQAVRRRASLGVETRIGVYV